MSFTTEAARWRALTIRDITANGQFVYSVKSTKIYCRPTCPGRLARRANVGFYKTSAEAQAAGFRACKRCKPDAEFNDDPQERAVNKACALIEEAAKEEGKVGLKLQDLAKKVGLTPRYFHKIFKDRMGVTPKEYAKATVTVSDGSNNDRLRAIDFDTFDFNDLLNFDVDPSQPLDATPAGWIGDAGLNISPITFGQEIDPNVQNLTWNVDCIPGHLPAELDGSGGNKFIYEQVAMSDTMGWEYCTPAVPTFEFDAPHFVNANSEFLTGINTDPMASWGR